MSKPMSWSQFTSRVRAGAYGTGATITTSSGGRVTKRETVTRSGVRDTTPTPAPAPTVQEPSKKTYVDTFGVVRVEGQTGFNPIAYQSAISSGRVSPTGGLPTIRTATAGGKIGGVFYQNLSQKELEQNKLDFNTRAFKDVSRTRLIQGRGTSADLFNVVSGGRRTIDLEAEGVSNAISRLVRTDQINRIIRQNATQETISNAKILTPAKLLEIVGKEVKKDSARAREITVLTNMRGTVIGISDRGAKVSYLLPDLSQKEIREQVKEIKTGIKASETLVDIRGTKLDQFLRKADTFGRVLTSLDKPARDYLTSVGTGFLKILSPDGVTNPLNDLRKLGVKIPQTEKVKQVDSFFDSFSKLTETERNKLKDKDVRNAILLTGIVVAPIIAKGYAGYNIFSSGKDLVGALGRGDAKGFITSGLSVALSVFILLAGGIIPKSGKPPINAKLGSIFKDKGRYYFVTKGGKSVIVPAKYTKALLKMERLGKPLRIQRTETARAMQKTLRGKPLTNFEKSLLKVSVERKALSQLVKDGNKLASSFGLKGSAKKEFTRLYVKYQNAPTKANIKEFKEFSRKQAISRVEVKVDKRTKIGTSLRKQRVDLERRTISPQKWLKQRKIPIKQLTNYKDYVREVMRVKRDILDRVNRYSKPMKKGSYFGKDGKLRINTDGKTEFVFKRPPPLGWTDGEEVVVMSKGLLKTSNIKIPYENLLRHEAIHILKRDSGSIARILKYSLANKLPYKVQTKIGTGIKLLQEARTGILESVPKTLKGMVRKVKPIDVKKLDLKLSNTLFKTKYGVSKSFVNREIVKVRSLARKLGAKQSDITKLNKLAFQRAVKIKDTTKQINTKQRNKILNDFTKKINKILNDLGKKKISAVASKRVSILDKTARKQGFRNNEQLKEYNIQLQRARAGIKGADRKLARIRTDMADISKALSIKRKEAYDRLVKDLVRQAKEKLSSGQLSIKNKKFKVVGKAKPSQQMSKQEVQRLLLQVNQRLNRIQDSLDKRNAKKAINEMINGKVVDTTPAVKGKIKQMINNEMYAVLKAKRLLLEKRLPKISPLTKAQRKAIKLRAKSPEEILKSKLEKRKARIERKRSKRKSPVKLVGDELILTSRGRKQALKIFVRQREREALRIVGVNTKKIRTFNEIIKKKVIPKGTVQKINRDGTIQLLKTEKVIKKLPKVKGLEKVKSKLLSQKQELVQVQKKLLTKTKTKTLTKTFDQVLSSAMATKFALMVAISKVARLESQIPSPTLTLTLSKSLEAVQSLVIKLEGKVATLTKTKTLTKTDTLTKSKVATLTRSLSKYKSILKQQLKLKQVIKKVPKKKVPKKEEKPIILPKFKLSWTKTPPKGYNYVVNALIRVGGKNREIRLKTTPNRALEFIGNKIDHTTARSFQLKLIGLTKKKDKKKPNMKKFRTRKGKDPKVLNIVEKTKFAIDTKGEKSGLSLSRLLAERRHKRLKLIRVRRSRVRKIKRLKVRRVRGKKPIQRVKSSRRIKRKSKKSKSKKRK